MPQIFHRSFNAISKASIFGALFVLAGIGWAYARWSRSDYVTGRDVVRDQPVQFSHQHHVAGLGIDCRYCHSVVETSAYAGMPPTQTCMNCHSQIWVNSEMLKPVRESYRTGDSIPWNRVYNLADYVYFNHSIHIMKGIGCTSCHGPVHQMPLLRQHPTLHMDWCLDCHRHPERYVRPREDIFNIHYKQPDDQLEMGRQLVKEYNIERETDCSTCHR